MQLPENETHRSEVTEVASKPRRRMSVQDRAKQFMPFAALKGLPEALAAKEKNSRSQNQNVSGNGNGAGSQNAPVKMR